MGGDSEVGNQLQKNHKHVLTTLDAGKDKWKDRSINVALVLDMYALTAWAVKWTGGVTCVICVDL